MKKYAMLFVAAVLLTACGGNPVGPTPDPFPTATPTPPPVIVKTVTFENLRPGTAKFASATDIGPARMQATVDWTNTGNTLWVVFADGPCTLTLGNGNGWPITLLFEDGGPCQLGPPVRGGMKPVTAYGTLTKNYKKNEEWVVVYAYSPTTNSGMEAGTIALSKLQ